MAAIVSDRPDQVERYSQVKVCVTNTNTQRQSERENEPLCLWRGRLLYRSNAICVCAFQTRSSNFVQEKRKRGKEEQSDGLPSQEVDDINKKLIILPQATSEGLATVIQCSLPLLLFLIHLTLYIPRKNTRWVGGERRTDSEVFGREGKETFCSSSRLAIDEAH